MVTCSRDMPKLERLRKLWLANSATRRDLVDFSLLLIRHQAKLSAKTRPSKRHHRALLPYLLSGYASSQHARKPKSCCAAVQAATCMAYYCNASHQTEDRPRHKDGCNKIKKSRKALEKEDKRLRDTFVPPGVFVDGVGQFSDIPQTNEYQTVRYKYARDLLQVFGGPGGRTEAVQEALNHLVDLIRLCGHDSIRVQDYLPHLYLRLGKDQEAYEFLRDFVVASDGRRPPVDAMEALPEAWTDGEFTAFSHTAAITLIKVKILLDLQAAQITARALDGTMPPEIIELIRGQLVGGIVSSRPDILLNGSQDLSALIEKVKGQMIELYRSANTYNPHFWRLMNSDPIQASKEWSGGFTRRTKDEACMWIGYCVSAWVETPGALDVMRELGKAA